MVKIIKHFIDKKLKFSILIVIIISVILYAINLKFIKQSNKSPSNTYEQVIVQTTISAHQSNKNFSHHLNPQQTNALIQQNSYSIQECAQLETLTNNNEEAFKQLIEQCAQQLAVMLSTGDNNQAITLLIKKLLHHWQKVDGVAAFKWLQQQSHSLMATNIAQFQALLINQLTIKNPNFAWSTFEFILTENNRQLLLDGLAQHWIKSDVSTALSWLANLEFSSSSPVTLTEREYHDVYKIAIHELSKIAPHLAFEETFRIKKASIQESVLQGMIDTVINEDAELTINFIAQIEDQDLRNNTMIYLINRHSNAESTAVIDYLLNNAKQFEPTLIHDSFFKLVELAPELASEKISQLPETLSMPMIATLLSTWLYTSENDALYWLENQTSEQHYDAGISATAKHFLLERPALAFQWASKVTDAGKRLTLLKNLVAFSIYDDPEELLDLIELAPLTLDEKQQLLNRVNDNRSTAYSDALL